MFLICIVFHGVLSIRFFTFIIFIIFQVDQQSDGAAVARQLLTVQV